LLQDARIRGIHDAIAVEIGVWVRGSQLFLEQPEVQRVNPAVVIKIAIAMVAHAVIVGIALIGIADPDAVVQGIVYPIAVAIRRQGREGQDPEERRHGHESEGLGFHDFLPVPVK
jgi:hypothetical protein